MKKITILTVLFFSIVMFQKSTAQINININPNTAVQPTWGPVGYDRVDYYYMPAIDAYYSVPQRKFIYPEGTRWIFANSLPARYGGYDLYNGYKVVVNEPRPYLHPEIYRVKYKQFKGGGPQQVLIRDSHDQRYKNNGPNNNPHHDNGNGKNKGHGNDKGEGHGNEGHGKGHGKG
jgi:hypothetical protein